MAINHRQVHVHVLSDPIEGRPNGAWVIEYHGEAFLTDPDGGNPEPFTWRDQASQLVESRARTRPPLKGFDVTTREDIARQLRINPALVAFVQRNDPTFPEPVATFSDGPIWGAEAIERWEPTRTALPLPLPDITESPHPGSSKPPG